MPQIKFKKAHIEDKKVKTEDTYDSIYDEVVNGNIVIFKNLFPGDILENLKNFAYEFGKSNEQKVAPGTIHHIILSGISERQKTPHSYHSYNFHRDLIHSNNENIRLLKEVFEPIVGFQNQLTENTYDSISLHPQIIHYPSGGGFLGKHVHPFLPQKIGLILSLSEKNEDFITGGASFEIDGVILDTQDVHNIGDLILFRFDVPHWVSPVDKNANLTTWNKEGYWTNEVNSEKDYVKFDDKNGRWVLVPSVIY